MGRHEEADQAFACADQRATSEPREVRQRIRRAYGFAVAERLPAQARAAFADWYMNELGHVGNTIRCKTAVDALSGSVLYSGSEYTLSLFDTTGRDQLLKRVRTVAVSDDPELARAARQLLGDLQGKKKGLLE